jgi:hypothetical protein
MRIAVHVCARHADAQDFAREVDGHYRERQMQKTTRRSVMLAVAALWSLPASAGDLSSPSVYVAPGGVYIGSAQVYVAPGAGNGGQPYVAPGAAYGPPVYGPGYVPPAPAYEPGYAVPNGGYAPTYYAPVPAYRAPPVAVYGARRTYVSPYAAEYAPRPPVAVPYGNGNGRNCVVAHHGRVFCN